MATKLPSGNWRVRWRLNSKRFHKTFPNKETADKFESQIKLNLVKNEVFNENETLTFSEFSKIWLRDYCYVEKSQTQWKNDEKLIEHHILPDLGNIFLDELRKSDLELLKRKLRSKDKMRSKGVKLKPKSINIILSLSKKIMNTAVEWDFVSSSPFSNVKLVKKVKQPFDYWSIEERDAFLSKCLKENTGFHDAVLIACHTGLRLGELAGLKWTSLDFRRKMITVKETYSYAIKTQLDRTKNGDWADIPMNTSVLTCLKQRKSDPADKEFVFPRETLKDACKKLKRKCRRYEIKEIRFHDLRHTFASCLAMAGLDLMVIKELMRHKSYSMTLRYAHLHPDHLTGKTEVLNGVMTQLGHESETNFLSGSRMGHETGSGKVLKFARGDK